MKKLTAILIIAVLSMVLMGSTSAQNTTQGNITQEQGMDNIKNAGNTPVLIGQVNDVNTIKTTAFGPSGTKQSITGILTGAVFAPTGDFKIKITNGVSFRGERFSTMICNLEGYFDRTNYDEEVVGLSTAFTINGETHNLLGYYTGMTAYPIEGYKVIILNARNHDVWNSMKCRIY